MSNLFYIWDSKLHAVPQTLGQAHDMFEKFMADALALEENGEEWEVERSDLLEEYVAELYDYWEKHELDEHNRPQFADGCEGLLIIEEGLMDEGQYYAAVQGTISRGLVFFHVDGGWVFLPDGRILPEEKQAGWEEFAKQQAEAARKPANTDQAFPKTKKEFTKRIYAAFDEFIKKHNFSVETKEFFSIFKNIKFGKIEVYSGQDINSMGVNFGFNVTLQYSPNTDDYYSNNYMNGRANVFSIKPLFFMRNYWGKSDDFDYLDGSLSFLLKNKNNVFFIEVLNAILFSCNGFYYKTQDMAWLNQIVNHNNLPIWVVSALPSLKLILASVNDDPIFDKIVEEGKQN